MQWRGNFISSYYPGRRHPRLYHSTRTDRTECGSAYIYHHGCQWLYNNGGCNHHGATGDHSDLYPNKCFMQWRGDGISSYYPGRRHTRLYHYTGTDRTECGSAYIYHYGCQWLYNNGGCNHHGATGDHSDLYPNKCFMQWRGDGFSSYYPGRRHTRLYHYTGTDRTECGSAYIYHHGCQWLYNNGGCNHHGATGDHSDLYPNKCFMQWRGDGISSYYPGRRHTRLYHYTGTDRTECGSAYIYHHGCQWLYNNGGCNHHGATGDHSDLYPNKCFMQWRGDGISSYYPGRRHTRLYHYTGTDRTECGSAYIYHYGCQWLYNNGGCNHHGATGDHSDLYPNKCFMQWRGDGFSSYYPGRRHTRLYHYTGTDRTECGSAYIYHHGCQWLYNNGGCNHHGATGDHSDLYPNKCFMQWRGDGISSYYPGRRHTRLYHYTGTDRTECGSAYIYHYGCQWLYNNGGCNHHGATGDHSDLYPNKCFMQWRGDGFSSYYPGRRHTRLYHYTGTDRTECGSAYIYHHGCQWLYNNGGCNHHGATGDHSDLYPNKCFMQWRGDGISSYYPGRRHTRLYHYTGTDRTECGSAYIYHYGCQWLYNNGGCNHHGATGDHSDLYPNKCFMQWRGNGISSYYPSRRHTRLYHYTGTDRTECGSAYIYHYRCQWLYNNGGCNHHGATGDHSDLYPNKCFMQWRGNGISSYYPGRRHTRLYHYTGTDRTECGSAYIYHHGCQWLYNNCGCNHHGATGDHSDLYTNKCFMQWRGDGIGSYYPGRRHTRLYHYTGTDRTECGSAYIYHYGCQWLYNNGGCNHHGATGDHSDLYPNKCFMQWRGDGIRSYYPGRRHTSLYHYNGTDRTECASAYIYHHGRQWLYNNGGCNYHGATGDHSDLYPNKCFMQWRGNGISSYYPGRRHTRLYHYTGTDRTECGLAYIYHHGCQWLYNNGGCNHHGATGDHSDLYPNKCFMQWRGDGISSYYPGRRHTRLYHYTGTDRTECGLAYIYHH